MSELDQRLLLEALSDTLFLVLITGLFLVVFGLLFGYLLYFSQQGHDEPSSISKKIFHQIFGAIIDIARSIPFVVLLIMMIPLTVIIMKTMLGAKAALPALIVSAVPFYGRITYNALKEVPKGNLEALDSMGASLLRKIIYLTKEAMPNLIRGLTIALVTLVGFIASAGAIGSGGLGDLAIKRAFVNDYQMMYISIALLLAIVFIIQLSGDAISRKIDKR